MANLNRLTRKRERGSCDRDALDALLDSVLVATASTVSPDGEPWALPLLFARDGDRILLHGSVGGGMLRHLAAGAPVALSVFELDGLVFADSVFDSSVNYRSAVLRGHAEPVPDEEKDDALQVLTNRLFPGRVSEVRPSERRELAATAVLLMRIDETDWIYKSRTGPEPEPANPTPEVWTGTVPMRLVAGEPQPDPWVDPSTPAPGSVLAVLRRHAEANPGNPTN